MDQISKYITYKEATRSTHADAQHLENRPDAECLSRMIAVGVNVFDKVREHFGVAIGISSFYRSSLVNKMIGGASNSQHCKGEAIDIDADIYGKITNADIFQYIKDNLVFDQLIWEFGNDDQPDWVHVSYSLTKNRGQVLISKIINGKTVYTVV